MSLISSKLNVVKPSPTLAVSAKAAELKASGVDVISLSAGEPDFDTPENIKQAAIRAIKEGDTKYTPASGTKQLKEAVINKFKRENNINYNLEEIIIGTGAKQVLYNLFVATINSGDEVIIPAPYWVSYPDMVLLAGGTPIIANCAQENQFKLTPNDLIKYISNNTKWVILNSPNNPSGATYSKSELCAIAEELRKYPHVNIASDDIYEHIMFGQEKYHTIAEVAPDLKDRIFTINGVSKAYAMTGWRIGYGAGNSKIIKAMSLIQSQSTSNPSSISQAAAVEALNGRQDFLSVNCQNFKEKRDLVLNNFRKIGIKCDIADGAFYLFPSCAEFFGKKTPDGQVIKSSNDFATFILTNAQVAVVPGIAFGNDNYFRISYATSKKLLQEACDRIGQAISVLI